MKLVSWNINGIRSLKKCIREVLEDLGADILCLQETKVNRSTLEDSIINIPGYSSYFSFPKHQTGYSGVATFCRNEIRPTNAEEGLSGEFVLPVHREDAVGFWPSHPDFSTESLNALEAEGRALITKHTIQHNNEIQDIVVINVYCPRVDCMKAERELFQLNFYKLLQRRAEELQNNRCGVFIVGDINVSSQPIDSCDPGDSNEFLKRPSRQWLNTFLQSRTGAGYFVDSFRHFYPEKENAYTCWCTLTGARKTNYGTRIDYILVDNDHIHLCKDSLILSEFEGSDHCPVGAVIDCQMIAAEKCPSICSRYWPEFSGQQRKLTDFLKVKEPEKLIDVRKRKNDVKRKQLSMARFVTKQSKCEPSHHNTELSDSVSFRPDLQYSTQDNRIVNHSDKKEVELSNYNDEVNHRKCEQVSAWKSMLRGMPKPPKCRGHSEVCLVRTVQKEGPNFGKQFFVCPRPIGDKSNKEARCDYFKWVV